MSREIKFRVWWIEDNDMDECTRIDLPNKTHNDKVICMQYIGLKDNGGNELYEDDVIADHVGVGVIEYSDKYAGFRVNYKNGRCKWLYDYNLRGERESIKKIGNIHESPELLEKCRG